MRPRRSVRRGDYTRTFGPTGLPKTRPGLPRHLRRLPPPESIEWTAPARPFFEPAAMLWRPRTDSNPQQQRSVLDWYLEVG